MTDEQWLWIFANQSLDTDEKLENMCPECRNEVTQHRCIRCGKKLSEHSEGETYINKNFDEAKYEALKNGTYKPQVIENEKQSDDITDVLDIDDNLVQQILDNSVGDSDGI